MPPLPCVLLVDDDDTTNFLNRLLLERMGTAAHLLVATNGRQALDLLPEHCPEPDAPTCPVLILLDINMPVMNGFEFLEAYAQLPPARRGASVILMLTSSLNPQDAERLRTLPAAGTIAKPLSKAKVAQVLHEHFGYPLPNNGHG
jgi:CheY-like chemotaxis protein